MEPREDNALSEARKVIDESDRAIAQLFEKRMEAVRKIAAFKMEHGFPIFDPKREVDVIERNSSLVNPAIRPYYTRFLESTMEVSRQYQRHLMQDAQEDPNGVDACN